MASTLGSDLCLDTLLDTMLSRPYLKKQQKRINVNIYGMHSDKWLRIRSVTHQISPNFQCKYSDKHQRQRTTKLRLNK